MARNIQEVAIKYLWQEEQFTVDEIYNAIKITRGALIKYLEKITK